MQDGEYVMMITTTEHHGEEVMHVEIGDARKEEDVSERAITHLKPGTSYFTAVSLEPSCVVHLLSDVKCFCMFAIISAYL